MVFAAVGLVALGLAVPGSLALLGAFSQTPQKFISDTGEPENARRAIQHFISQQPNLDQTLTGIQSVVSANTPEGEYGVYKLTFTDGVEGTAVISSATGGVAGMGWGPPAACPAGWALQAGLSMVAQPGKTPLYADGRVSYAVASVDVVYPDGHTQAAAVSDGYFLAWVVPTSGAPNSTTGFSPLVTLVARDSAGNEIGHLTVRSDGDIPPAAGQPAQARACG